jgi:hypothetical protein
MKLKTAKTKSFHFLLFILTIVFLVSCSNKTDVSACLDEDPYGFWNGLWHGIIAPIDLIAMIWRDDVSAFAENNNGFWYAFGFVLGSGGWGFLGAKGSQKKYREREA